MLYFHDNIIGIILFAMVIVISMVLHELAHGYVALWNGDATAKVNGRLTPNPLAHFDIIGFFMLMTVGFGYAKPVPVNPFNFRHQKRGIFTVAIAGVTVNFILAFLSFGLMAFFSWLQVKFPGAVTVLGYFRLFFTYMVIVNLSLFFFNLLPLYPLDGFRVIEAFTRYNNRVAQFFRKYGQYILLALVGVGIIVDIIRRVAYVPIWCDPLGAYIYYCREGVWWLFGKFWWLFF
ncbi:MAG: site-2 protease family protein [Clostridia bacterium]|nr:site-2 protease family protein [Clostridia bacterium]